MSIHKKKINRKKPKKRKKLSLKGVPNGKFGEISIIRNPMPDAIYLTLKGEDYGFFGNVGSLYNGEFYAMNDAFSPSTINTIPMIPLAEYGQFFNTYKVLTFRMKSTFSALESFPIFCAIGPSTTSLGTNNSLLHQFSTNQYWKRGMISAKGGMDRLTLKITIHLPNFYGEDYLNNAAFSGGVGGAPSTLLYMNHGTFSSSNTVSGTQYMNQLEMDVLLFKKDMFSS